MLHNGGEFQNKTLKGIIHSTYDMKESIAPSILTELKDHTFGWMEYEKDSLILSTSDNINTLKENGQVSDASLKDYFQDGKHKLIIFGHDLDGQTVVLNKDGTATTKNGSYTREQAKNLGKNLTAIGVWPFDEKGANAMISEFLPKGQKIKLSDNQWLVILEMVGYSDLAWKVTTVPWFHDGEGEGQPNIGDDSDETVTTTNETPIVFQWTQSGTNQEGWTGSGIGIGGDSWNTSSWGGRDSGSSWVGRDSGSSFNDGSGQGWPVNGTSGDVAISVPSDE